MASYYVEINHDCVKAFAGYCNVDENNNIIDFYEYNNEKVNILLDKTDHWAYNEASNTCIPNEMGFNIMSDTLQRIFNTNNNHFNITNYLVRTSNEGVLKMGNIYFELITDTKIKYYILTINEHCIDFFNIVLMCVSNVVIYAFNLDNFNRNILMNNTVCVFYCEYFDVTNSLQIYSPLLQQHFNTVSDFFDINALSVTNNGTILKMGNIVIKELIHPHLTHAHLKIKCDESHTFDYILRVYDNQIYGVYSFTDMNKNLLLHNKDTYCIPGADNVYPITSNGFNCITDEISYFYNIETNRININKYNLQTLDYGLLPSLSIELSTLVDADCYLVGTRLTIIDSNMDDITVNVENIRKGNILKIYKNTYKKITSITKKFIVNNNTVYKTTINNNTLYTTKTKKLLLDKLSNNEKTKSHLPYFGKYLINVEDCDSSVLLNDNNIYEMYYIELDSDDRKCFTCANNILTAIFCNYAQKIINTV